MLGESTRLWPVEGRRCHHFPLPSSTARGRAGCQGEYLAAVLLFLLPDPVGRSPADLEEPGGRHQGRHRVIPPDVLEC